MSDAQIHLLLNHVPILGVPVAALLLMAAALRRSEDLAKAGLWALLVAGLAAVPVYLTGHGAEELVEHLPGVVESAIHAHEEAAEAALTGVLVLGAGGLLALAFAWKRRAVPWRGVYALLAASLPVFGLLAYAGHLGGLIRHPELRGAAGPAVPGAQAPEDDD
jgi:uncharacterized membrane protein